MFCAKHPLPLSSSQILWSCQETLDSCNPTKTAFCLITYQPPLLTVVCCWMHFADDAAQLEGVAVGKENITSDALAVATQALQLQPLVARASQLPAALKGGKSRITAADGEHSCLRDRFTGFRVA